ncbi:MAG: acetyl-CoA hydrolase/transferase C-terminal domain-containing protein [Paracoccaceae bacterium]
MTRRPERHDDARLLADRIIAETGGDVRLGLPLGIGKAPHIANALFERARDDASIRLRIFTALSLEPPAASGDLERRFIGPLVERIFAGWPRLGYIDALRGEGLPANIEVNEFFLQAGAWMSSDRVQQSYTSINYSQATAMLREADINVVAQLVAPDPDGGGRLSLSSNPDLTLDMLDIMRFRGGACLLVGQENAELPFMPGDAALEAAAFDHILAGDDAEFPLFAPPNAPVSTAEHAIGFRVAAMVPDGGTVQIGIGSIGDALGEALIMRHRAPALFAETLDRLGGGPVGALRHAGPFEKGLYGVSEMFAPAFLELYRAGILKRRAADGAVLHAGFFLGPRDFYRRLRESPAEERALFQMRPISFTNTLDGDREAKVQDRRDARFVNNAMEASLLGDVASDTLADGRVVSGVGGQHDFAIQAQNLPGARAIIALTATRETKGETLSRIVARCGRATLPRHLRDVIVTEYGLADLRNRPDGACVAAMLALAEGRFAAALGDAAARAGKAAPGAGRDSKRNTPERIEEALAPARRAGWCAEFPFGADFTETERRLLGPLKRLKSVAARPARLCRFAAAALFESAACEDEKAMLNRLALDKPSTLRERISAKLVLRAARGG